jgi:hypothetical protein
LPIYENFRLHFHYPFLRLHGALYSSTIIILRRPDTALILPCANLNSSCALPGVFLRSS